MPDRVDPDEKETHTISFKANKEVYDWIKNESKKRGFESRSGFIKHCIFISKNLLENGDADDIVKYQRQIR